jgi:hypothetical protein
LSLTGGFAWAAVDPSADSPQSLDKPWALQLGYFSNLQNALDLKEQLSDSGFVIEVITTGKPGEQYYRVIGGWAHSPEDFDSLRNKYENATGERGYVVQNPYLESQQLAAEQSGDDPFEQPRTRYLLAQAGNARPMGGEGLGSSGISRNDPDVFRTPQEEMASIPGFTAAGLNIIPTIGLSIGYDDNVTRANIEEIDSFFYMISPAIRVELPSDRSILAVTAAANIVRYTDSERDNRDNWYVRGDWAWDPTSRQDLNLFAQYGEGTDARGTGRRQGDSGLAPIDPDDWKRIDYGGIWRYGAIGARGRLDVMAGGSDLEYTNNRESTYLLDRDWQYIGGTFYWRLAPKTSALAQVLYTDISYDFADTDSKETSWLLGLSWDASARTSGTIRYGNLKKKFDNPVYENYDGPTWLGSISWRPRTYSVFTLTGTRNTREPDGDGDYVLRQDISLAWLHDWATRFGTVVDVGIGEDDYRPDGRTDDLFYWSVGARYMFNQHFRLGASIQSYDRDSDIEEFSYKRHIYMLTLEASL